MNVFNLAAVAVVMTAPAVATAVVIAANAVSVSIVVTARTGHHAAASQAARMAPAKAAGVAAEKEEGEAAVRAAEEAVERAAGEAAERAAGAAEAMEGVTGDPLSKMLHLKCCILLRHQARQTASLLHQSCFTKDSSKALHE